MGYRTCSSRIYMREEEAEAFLAKTGRTIMDWRKEAKAGKFIHFYRFSPDQPYGEVAVERKVLESWIVGEFADQTKERVKAAQLKERVERGVRESSRSLLPRIRFQVLKRDGYRCQVCGASPKDGTTTLEVDHKLARAKGGTHHMDNLWTLCWLCNRGKGMSAL